MEEKIKIRIVILEAWVGIAEGKLRTDDSWTLGEELAIKSEIEITRRIIKELKNLIS